MRTIAPLEIQVRRFGVWRMGVIGLVVAACAALAAWWSAHPSPRSSGVSVGTVAGLLASMAALLGLAPRRPVRLRWDGQCWHLAREGSAEDIGTVEVAIDLGTWLLLRFAPGPVPARPRWRRVCWIAVQRRGLEAQWHALRLTLYGARPGRGGAGEA